jgi:hypothetical protein
VKKANINKYVSLIDMYYLELQFLTYSPYANLVVYKWNEIGFLREIYGHMIGPERVVNVVLRHRFHSVKIIVAGRLQWFVSLQMACMR